jgi:hypothetical protein
LEGRTVHESFDWNTNNIPRRLWRSAYPLLLFSIMFIQRELREIAVWTVSFLEKVRYARSNQALLWLIMGLT